MNNWSQKEEPESDPDGQDISQKDTGPWKGGWKSPRQIFLYNFNFPKFNTGGYSLYLNRPRIIQITWAKISSSWLYGIISGIYTGEICLLERLLFCSMSGKTSLKYEFVRDTQLNIMPDNKTFIFKPSVSLFWHLHRKMISPCHLSGERYHYFSTTLYSSETPWRFYLLQALASHTFKRNFSHYVSSLWHSHIPPLKGENDLIFHTFTKFDRLILATCRCCQSYKSPNGYTPDLFREHEIPCRVFSDSFFCNYMQPISLLLTVSISDWYPSLSIKGAVFLLNMNHLIWLSSLGSGTLFFSFASLWMDTYISRSVAQDAL